MVSLRKLARDRILIDMLQVVDQNEGQQIGWKVLALDPWTRDIVDSACSVTDLVTAGVVAVRLLGAPVEENVVSLPVVYFVFPDSTQNILKEWEECGSLRPPQLHVFYSFTPDASQQKALTNHPLMTRATLRGTHTLNLGFRTTEQRVFECPVPKPLRAIYHTQLQHAPLCAQLKAQLGSVADLLDIAPEVRYLRTGTLGAALAKELAKLIAQEVYHPLGKGECCNAVILVIDRVADLVAPLIHDLTVQAMTHDFLPLDHNSVIATADKRQKILRETNRSSNELWKSVRHAHIAEALTFLEAEKDTQKSKAIRSERDFEELGVYSESVKVVPSYKMHLVELLTMIDLLHGIERSFHAQHMYRIVLLEQTLVTLRYPDGNEVGVNLALRLVRTLMADETVQVDPNVMQRLITLLFIQFPSVPKDHRKTLMNIARLSEYQQQTVNSITSLGTQLSAATSTTPLPAVDPSLFEGVVKVAHLPKSMCRYAHRLRGMTLAALQGKLEIRAAPYMTPTSSAQEWRVQKKKNRSGVVSAPSLETRTLVLFVLGGITHGEISAVYDICSMYHCEVFLGSTGIITSANFMTHLSELN